MNTEKIYKLLVSIGFELSEIPDIYKEFYIEL